MSLRVRELTPPGGGAVSVLAISGTGALDAVRSLSGAARIPIGRPSRLRLRADGEDLDESIVCAFHPGEVELHLHGSPAVVRRVIACLGVEEHRREGAGSIEDLAQDLLAGAVSESAARILLDQAEGAFARDLRSLVTLHASERVRSIDTLLARWRIARRALRPATVVIAGRANAGKSTLFNAILGEQLAIVDAEPGTTRDLNRARARLGKWPVTLVDTAGERDLPGESTEVGAQASIEEHGQARARAAVASADLILWLEPIGPLVSVPSFASSGSSERTILVRTFADRVDPRARPALAVSALEDPTAARDVVAGAFRASLALPEDPWTPGAGVPFTEGLALAVEGLREVGSLDLAHAVEDLVRWPLALPRPGCGGADDPLECPPGSA